ncbi:MAG: hypothetical protein C0483_23925 [Pirellula sp.]|nr:hypothetical protein [Pirellula sp.]
MRTAWMLGSLLVGGLVLNVAAARLSAAEAAPLVEDRYQSKQLEGRRPTRGPWKIADGTAQCTQDDELFKKFKDHGPVVWYDAKFTDAAIHFEFKPEKTKTFVFTVNGDEGHVFRFVSSAAGTTIVAFPPNPEHKSQALERGGPKLSEGVWTKVSVELRGPKAVVNIGDDYQAEVEHASLEWPKTVVGLGFSFGTLSLRNFRIVPIPAK